MDDRGAIGREDANMATMKKIRAGVRFMGRLAHGADLLEELVGICLRENIQLGRVEAIGAVRKARLGFYNQEARQYCFIEMDTPLEIVNLSGNVSSKDGRPFVHAHVTLADEEGRAFGGHLAPGTEIFAGECMVESFDGNDFVRGYDEETGLPLWDIRP